MPKDLNILVIDDDPILLDLLHDTLEAIGYKPTTSQTAFEALEEINQQSFDLVISDIHMPGMDGLELLKQIKAKQPELPVLFISGHNEVEVIGEAVPDGFLAKPFRINMLESLIEKTVNKKPESSSKIRKVLVVDDEEIFNSMLVETLNYYSYEPFGVKTAEHAIEVLESDHFDAVVTDFRMPGMDGLQLASHIKSTNQLMPVILVTAHLDKESVADALKTVQIDGFLRKPFPIESVVQILKQL